jgi:hydroxymethylglutaryl-CoA lyase
MIRIVEVGPRDGLQNEASVVKLTTKMALVEMLADAGMKMVEAGSFVSPRWVPQMADSGEVFRQMRRVPGVVYPALVPNLKGFEAAMDAGVTEVAVFVSASEGFSERNIACSRQESLNRLGPVMEAASARGVAVRGYVSCVIACPFDGPVAPAEVAAMAARLVEMGCYEVSLGDTIGVGTAGNVRAVIAEAAAAVGEKKIAMHFHDTYGQGVANVLASLDAGITAFDASVGGLGGCPFAPGATGNVATEDVLFLLHGLGLETGIDLAAVAKIGAWISDKLGRPNMSRAGNAMTKASGKLR